MKMNSQYPKDTKAKQFWIAIVVMASYAYAMTLEYKEQKTPEQITEKYYF